MVEKTTKRPSSETSARSGTTPMPVAPRAPAAPLDASSLLPSDTRTVVSSWGSVWSIFLVQLAASARRNAQPAQRNAVRPEGPRSNRPLRWLVMKSPPRLRKQFIEWSGNSPAISTRGELDRARPGGGLDWLPRGHSADDPGNSRQLRG